MRERRPAHELAAGVVIEDRYRDRPVLVCGPPRAPGAAGMAVDDVVADGFERLVRTFFRRFTTTPLDGDAGEWGPCTPADDLERGVRDGRVGCTTDQSRLGGPERPGEGTDLVESVIDGCCSSNGAGSAGSDGPPASATRFPPDGDVGLPRPAAR